MGRDEVLGTDQPRQLAPVELGHEHLLELEQDVAEIRGERVEVPQVDVSH